MSSTEPANEPVEHRFALVMNGGVSLAVWMGGVAREIDNARRASAGLALPADATDTERDVHRLWTDAIANANVQLSVDVIAGTSAGGLNGVLLAAAIARGTPLSGLKKLWIEAGQMSADALFSPQGDNPSSLMNGDFFHDKIRQALDGMTAAPEATRRDVSLIVTSTALGDSARQVADTRGRLFGAADHRRRYRFSRHPARPTYNTEGHPRAFADGEPGDDFAASEPLATAARATASFPAAFQPVHETPELRAQRVFPNWVTSDERDWLADGGILDNSPFDPVLQSIQHKPVTGSWRRTVVFVEPDADELARGDVTPIAPAKAAGGEPPPWTSVVLSALNFPGEISFRDDIEHLHDAIRDGRSSLDVSRFRTLTYGSDAAKQLERARAICVQAIELYRQSAQVAAVAQTRDLVVRARPNSYLDPVAAVGDQGLDPANHDWLPDSFPASDDPLPARWEWGVDTAGRVLRTILRSTSGGLSDVDADEEARLRGDLSAALDRVTAVERAVNRAIAATPVDNGLGDDDIVTLLDDAYRDLGVAEQLAPIVSDAVRRYAAVTAGSSSDENAAHVLTAALSVEVSNGAGAAPDNRPRPFFDFDRLGLDEPPRMLRAAFDAATAAPAGGGAAPARNNILYGTRLGHFAAFAVPDWRRWDWLWGRLNSLAHLAALLGIGDDAVDELAHAVIKDEGRTVEEVEAQIKALFELDFDKLKNQLLREDRVPAVVDALLEFVRSDPKTQPPMMKPLVRFGQVLSDVLARKGHQGNVRHRLLRFVASPARRHVVWRHLEPPK